MILKFPFKFTFKFTFKYSTRVVYTALLGEYGGVIVYWAEEDGTIEKTDYSLREVEVKIRDGIWSIIEEPRIDHLVEIRQSEYDALIEEINLLQELLAEANKCIAELETNSKFKPVKDMTYKDWVAAFREGQEFKTRDGVTVTILQMDDEDSNWPIRTEDGWYRLDGRFGVNTELSEDIIERIS